MKPARLMAISYFFTVHSFSRQYRAPMVKSGRLPEIDALRGLAIVLMALDHTRDYFGDHSIDALDLAHTHIALFFARWLTHFCAPTFVCLAGMSVALAAHRRPVNRPFLVGLATRGLWLVILEQTLLRCFGWYFNFLMLGNELLASLPGNSWWWTMLFRSNDLGSAGWHFYVSYPVLPWFGVMAFGYGIAMSISLPQKRIVERRRTIGSIGIVLLITFLFLRSLNWGDPSPWTPRSQTLFSILSFVNLEKYPPSIDFLLMTLGVMLCCLAVADFLPSSITRFLVNLGQVPLFFYLKLSLGVRRTTGCP